MAHVTVQFIEIVSYRGRMRNFGEVMTISKIDADILASYRQPVVKILSSKPKEKQIVVDKPKEKKIETIKGKAGWYEIKIDGELHKRIRGVDNVNRELEIIAT